jgi:glycosyltransferase involved in cell wall biosynthesis
MKQLADIGYPKDRTFEFEVNLQSFVHSARSPQIPALLREFRALHTRVLLFVGRIQCDKGILDLLHAFGTLDNLFGRGHVGLVYVGDGKDSQKLTVAVAQSAASQSVLMLGKLQHEALPAVMQAADIVVAPTRPEFPEGRCMVVLESLVLGVPVVAPDFGPFPFAVEHGVDGMLYRAGDANDLAEKLSAILRDEVLHGVKAGARRASEMLLTARRSFADAVDAAFGELRNRTY